MGTLHAIDRRGSMIIAIGGHYDSFERYSYADSWAREREAREEFLSLTMVEPIEEDLLISAGKKIDPHDKRTNQQRVVAAHYQRFNQKARK